MDTVTATPIKPKRGMCFRFRPGQGFLNSVRRRDGVDEVTDLWIVTATRYERVWYRSYFPSDGPDQPIGKGAWYANMDPDGFSKLPFVERVEFVEC